MPTYYVTVPFAGAFTVAVEADNENDAKAAGLGADVTLTIAGEGETEVTDWEWEAHRQITQGNILYARHNEISVEEIADD